MFGGFGGEGTDQEGCWTQQVVHLQYVPYGRFQITDTNLSLARAVAAAE
jgi:hypothetical protein